MKKHLNTLFVTTDGAYLKKDGEAVAVRIEKETRLRLPLHNLDGIVCMGRVGCSPPLMAACAKAGVSISFHNCYGGFQAAVVGFSPGNVLLRRTQYRVADDLDACVKISREMVAAKIANSRNTLLRTARDSNDDASIEMLSRAARRMKNDVDRVRNETDLDRLRGYEGESKCPCYCSVQGKVASFTGRVD